MANTINDLADALFRQLDRLDNAEGDDAINVEVSRARAVMGVASSINDAYRLELDVVKTRAEIAGYANAAKDARQMDRMLTDGKPTEKPYYAKQRDADAEVDERSKREAVTFVGK